MAKQATTFDLALLSIDPRATPSRYAQLYSALRDAILRGQISPGTRLPSTRDLARSLRLSRNTVTAAYEQLVAEGYLESRVGAGTYVSSALPDELLYVHTQRLPPHAHGTTATIQLSKRHRAIVTTPMGGSADEHAPRAFRTGIPALDAFPYGIWSRLVARHWRNPTPELLTYGDAVGYWPLRQAIANYLGAARGVHCAVEQVLITAGSQHALDLIAHVLLNPGDPVWIEDPGYRGARAALLGAGATLVPVPLDEEGLSVEAGIRTCAKARMAYVTPSHQYPTGVTMSVARRLALLEWAHRANGWILEDDYDSEYRYHGHPLAALQGLDRRDAQNRVLYTGTFSKVLFPGLRLGYLVAPLPLVAEFTQALYLAHRYLSVIDQAVLSDFINEGHFARHIRRMRTLYAQRQQVLIEAIHEKLATYLTVDPTPAGLHLVGWLQKGMNDRVAADAAGEAGVEVAPISGYTLVSDVRHGLVLGYAMLDEGKIVEGVEKLRRVLQKG
ncbi:MAG TPA: PLP-dependent aminotransferase family protein [Caldilineaceae bacterium]|nr:PLP-dependent aminotransferase family protein [Caldilineaceae bacterium]